MTSKEGKLTLDEATGNAKFMEGAKAAYDFVTTTFGPRGKNVRLEKVFGRPVLTRDGVTAAREVYFSDRPKNLGAQAMIEASETSNRIAGDGTTVTIGLGYNLLKQGEQAIAAGIHPMEIADIYRRDERTILDRLDELSKPATGTKLNDKGKLPKDSQLVQVATISSGSPQLGELIAETIARVGPDGGVMVEKAPLEDIEREYIDGYYLQSGFQALQGGKKEMLEPLVIVFNKRIASAADIGDILGRAAAAKGLEPGKDIFKFLLIGNVDTAAYDQVVQLLNARQVDAIILKTPPHFGEMGKELLEDIAIYCGCTSVGEGTKTKEIGLAHIGYVNRVVANKSEATLFSDKTTERMEMRVSELKDQIASESVDAILERLRDRVAKLEGKIALFKIGGATETEKEELEFRVEDALQSTRAAHRHGVVAGGGATMLELSKAKVGAYYQRALQETVKKLFLNARPNGAEVLLKEALALPTGQGFNLRTNDDVPVDMVKAGILDATLVISEAIRNATSVAAENLKVGATSVFEDDKPKEKAGE